MERGREREQQRHTVICSGVQESRLTLLTLEMWTPRFLWIPAHLMHMNTPRFQDAHRGPESVSTEPPATTASSRLPPLAWQSAQNLFSSSLNMLANISWCFSWSLLLPFPAIAPSAFSQQV